MAKAIPTSEINRLEETLAEVTLELAKKHRALEIEAALERVRAKVMGMSNSNELNEISFIFGDQLRQLGIDWVFSYFWLIEEDKGSNTFWITWPDKKSSVTAYPMDDPGPLLTECLASWRRGDQFHSNHLPPEHIGDFLESFEQLITDAGSSAEQMMRRENFPQGLYYYDAMMRYGSFGLCMNRAATEEAHQIQCRFAIEFERAYMRFLELQKAEAQAKEAQIEAALERVRSRTMAMQKSAELQEVIQVVYEQFVLLNIRIDHCGFVMDYKTRDDYHIWIADRVASPSQITIPYFDCVYYNQFNAAKEKGIDFFATNLSFEDKNKFYQDLFNHVPGLPEEALEFLLTCPGLALSTVLLDDVCLYIENFSGIPYTDKENHTLMRFGNVFQQTYTRFHDLQKAEAQAREAKIEAALERVRSRTMAMQRSSELGEVAAELFAQMNQLVTNLWTGGFVLCEKNRDEDEWWLSMDGDFTRGFFLPNIGDYAHVTLYEGWLKGDAFRAVQLDGEALQQHYDWLTEVPVSRAIFEEMDAAGLERPDWQKLHAAYFSKGYLVLITREPCGEEEVFKRFAQVFDQTYTRFLDLQKAEAQAREARIEVALERVRAQTMAMHKSEELAEASKVLFHELHSLGIETIRSGFGIFDAVKKTVKVWMTTVSNNLMEQKVIGIIPVTAHPAITANFNAWKQNQTFLSHEFVSEEVQQYYKALAPYVALSEQEILHEKEWFNAFFFSEGAINVITDQRLSEEQCNIISRFARVFGLTYRRFLDLQKAEAQTREAQIEASLERVRSRTMAMHKSDELLQVITILAEQLQQLNFRFGNVSFAVRNQDHDYKFWFSGPGLRSPYHIHVPYINNPMFERVRHFQKEDLSIYTDILSIEESSQWHQHVFENSELKTLSAQTKDHILKSGYARTIVFMPTIMFIVGNYASQPYTEEDNNIFKRFAGVFEQSYTRFLDLQKAEAQTREAQIEAALERVRSKTMAMHKSDELASVVNVMFNEFRNLQTAEELATLSRGFINNIYEEQKQFDLWVTDLDGSEIKQQFFIDVQEPTTGKPMYDAWRTKQPIFILDREDEKLHGWLHYLESIHFNVPPEMWSSRRVSTFIYYSEGFIGITSFSPLSESNTQILRRFAKVFEQTYTRFLDLQKAEAQTREAQIEAALERVRSKAMAMHKSDDLNPAVATVFEELEKLSPGLSRCGIGIIDREKRMANAWITSLNDEGTTVQISGDEPMDAHPLLQGAYEAWLREEDFSYVLKGKDMTRYYETSGSGNVRLPDSQLILIEDTSKQQHYHFSVFQDGGLFAFRDTEFPEEVKAVMKRFAGVFNLTYQRFLDLQKAEANAREAQIEASLERVRAHAMAMHNSADLSATVNIFFKELKTLGIIPMRCGVGEMLENTHTSELVFTTADKQGELYELPGKLVHEGHPVIENIYNYWKRQEEYHPVLQGTDIIEYYKVIKSQMILPEFPEYTRHFGNYFYFKEGFFFAWAEKEFTEEAMNIFRKFTSVLSLTYKRYKDLKLAEAQAREAQIEAALERVRGKAMAMQTSNDLSTTASTVFVELRKLGIHSIRSGVGLLTKESRKVILYAATSSKEGDHLSLVGWAMLQDHPVLSEIYDRWIRHEDYFPILKGELLQSYYEKILSSFSVPGSHYKQNLPDNAFTDSNSDYAQHGHFLAFSEGFLYGWSEKPYTESEIKILHRFKLIIDLTFRRYIELQKSEANARDAVRQASLDRVRAETASMRTTTDLERITPLMWNELTTLGVQFIRCGVFIMDDEAQIVHTYLNTREGKDIAAIHLPYVGIPLTEQAVAHWRNQSIYTEYWNKVDFLNWTRQLIDLGHIKSAENYQAGSAPEQLHLHFIPFTQGMLYVGSVNPLPEESIDLIHALAGAFATAYARYEDFSKLEVAKKSTDLALADLEAAKDQLVQQEKLASLGQLTAGIAHEIKNPLNFVNNFSEVSCELLDEMLEELENGNSESVKSISETLKANLNKIHEHGTRADSIVKSMLLHSRGGSGQKEPTDINALIREYVNLTFHGMRAGKQPINVQIDLQLDEAAGTVPVIVEDISRVIVNLCNNAFDAMRSKLVDPLQKNGYTPKLTVRTKWEVNHAMIEIADNGPGIPEVIKDKILQPFFTTKKGTQGTGLGLSITNDIVKAHGGELMIETKEGAGATFIIQLPR